MTDYPRFLSAGPWFAWRPVFLVRNDDGAGGGIAWLRTVRRERWGRRCGDHYFEWSLYALLP